MPSPTINGESLGHVDSIAFDLRGDIEEITLPGSDSSGTITFDYGGVIQEIVVQGTFSGETADVKTDVGAIKALLNGSQMTGVSFVSDVEDTLTVKIKSFNVTWVNPQNRAEYTLTMVQGD